MILCSQVLQWYCCNLIICQWSRCFLLWGCNNLSLSLWLKSQLNVHYLGQFKISLLVREISVTCYHLHLICQWRHMLYNFCFWCFHIFNPLRLRNCGFLLLNHLPGDVIFGNFFLWLFSGLCICHFTRCFTFNKRILRCNSLIHMMLNTW